MESENQTIPFFVQVTETVTTLRFVSVQANHSCDAEEKAQSFEHQKPGTVISQTTEAVALDGLGHQSKWAENHPCEVTWGGMRCIQVNAAAQAAGLTFMDVAIAFDTWAQCVVSSPSCGSFIEQQVWDILHASSLSYDPAAVEYTFRARIRDGRGPSSKAVHFRAVQDRIGDTTRLLISTAGPSRKWLEPF